MARDDVDDGVRWGLVRPAGLLGLIETVACGLERLFGARARAQAMAGVAAAAAEAGVRAEVMVVEGEDCYWTMTVVPPGLADVAPAEAEARQE